MPPPPPSAASIAPRFLLGPALRTQPDRRLVSLVREGYETAFEEIVRRYGKALGRYAAAIVPNHRAEDVTQDAFSKALLALRGTENEIELRPWLYRIVRNTALNDLRDQPAPGAPLLDSAEAPGSLSEQIERREELKDLMTRLRALPEPQRAAIVMRELEGLSHDEIAAALGISGGAARQAIHRARVGLRDGIGMLFPLPLLRWMLAGAPGLNGEVAGGGVVAGAAGGAGSGIALKAAAATLLVAGSVGTGVAIHNHARDHIATADGAVARLSGTTIGATQSSGAPAGSASSRGLPGAGPAKGSVGPGGSGSRPAVDDNSGAPSFGSSGGGPGSSVSSGPGTGPVDGQGASGDGSGHQGSGGPEGQGAPGTALAQQPPGAAPQAQHEGPGGPGPSGGGSSSGEGPGGGSHSGEGSGGSPPPPVPPPLSGSGSGSGGRGSGGSGSESGGGNQPEGSGSGGSESGDSGSGDVADAVSAQPQLLAERPTPP